MSRNETQDEFRTVMPQSSTVLTEELRTRILGGPPSGQDFREVREFQCSRCGERVGTPFTPHCCATLPVDTTNPKDLVGETKVPTWLWPPVGTLYGAMGFKDGAKKYGPYNWRDKKVRMTVYLSAIERHLLALRDGEDFAADSGQRHLAHILSNAALLADATEGGFLIDDRPQPGPTAAVLERFKEAR